MRRKGLCFENINRCAGSQTTPSPCKLKSLWSWLAKSFSARTNMKTRCSTQGKNHQSGLLSHVSGIHQLVSEGDIKNKYRGFPWRSQFSSVAQSCPTLCDPVDGSTPGFPVHHRLLELAQTHDHPGDPVFSNSGDTGSTPGLGTKIPHASGKLSPRAVTKTQRSQIEKE